MNKYNGLLQSIASELAIYKGDQESESQWKCRIIYSVLGRMACASVRDKTEDGTPISVAYVKQRMRDVFSSYKTMYPELIYEIGDGETLIEEIYQCLERTGQFYHSPYHVIPAKPSSSMCGHMLATRGFSLSVAQYVSGLGTYCFNTMLAPSTDVINMFQLSKATLQEQWKLLNQRVQWQSLHDKTQMEFLKMKTPFSKGYWEKQPQDNATSLCRTIDPTGRLYYLYRYQDQQLLVSPLPTWMVERRQYLLIANACLKSIGTLPVTNYSIDGKLVRIHLNYLWDCESLDLLKLYSWPRTMLSVPSDFNRVMTTSVFFAVKPIYEAIGYEFREE